eukprot:2174273-Pleurochrysis_carterae.AAC.1
MGMDVPRASAVDYNKTRCCAVHRAGCNSAERSCGGRWWQSWHAQVTVAMGADVLAGARLRRL